MTKKRPAAKHTAAGRRLLASARQAFAWAKGEMLRYPVKLERDTNGTILVSFPDLPEAHTFGHDRAEALARAADALETALMGYVENRQAIPAPSPFKRGPYVALPASTEAKLLAVR